MVLLFDFEQECRTRGWGFELDGFALPIILFADNCWFLAKGADELVKMTELWIGFLKMYSFHNPVE